MGSSMSANVSEETRRSPRSNSSSKRSLARSPSPRSVQQHPSVLALSAAAEHPTRIPRSFLDGPLLEQPEPPTDQFWQLLRQRDWDRARYRLRTHPRDAAWLLPAEDGTGTPLHWACRLQCPFVMQVVRAWPVALWTPDAAGWLPLHVGLVHLGGSSSSSSSDDDNGDDETTTALVELIRAGGTQAALACVTPPQPEQSLTVVGTALHLACRHGVSAIVLTELLLQCAKNGNKNNKDDALQRLLRCPEPKLPADLVYQHYIRKKRQRVDPDQANFELLQRWYLLMAAAQGRPLTGPPDDRGILGNIPRSQPLFSLHQVLEFEHECTSPHHSVVSVYLQFHPTAAMAVHRRNGRLPLHTACALAMDFHSVQTIVRAHPEAARIRDATGQLPLQVLLLENQTLVLLAASSTTMTHAPPPNNNNSNNHPWVGVHHGWHILLEAHPLALETRCPVTRLFPYQLAALPRPDASNNQNGTDVGGVGTTNLIYTLIRACPQVVR